MAYILGESDPNSPLAIPLVTKRGRRIPNAQRLPQGPTHMKAAKEVLASPARKLRSLTSEYNCVGLIFASRRTWVDPSHLHMIFEDDGYRRISEAEAMVGDVVLYKDGEGDFAHVAIIIEKSPDVNRASWKFEVLSQWGADGEYLHSLEDVPPLLGRPEEFWTERII
jgi:hypothetical protein